MFSNTIQPPTVSLFSSTGTDPLQLFSVNVDKTLPADSFVHLLHDATSVPAPPTPAVPIVPAEPGTDDESGHAAGDRVNGLGLRHPWLHVQVRDLRREWAFEVGLVDQARRVGIIRLSTFQKHPRLTLHPSAPLLHLPFSFPDTPNAWCTLNLHLPTLLPYFTSGELTPEGEPGRAGAALPGGMFAHVAYVRLYATCRVRRIWFSEGGSGGKMPWEFELYGVD
ncbi:hypothetical protein BD779DRAFT_1799760 [Infundibulicybe gibba]|nr:hypothetical protein BD779DRAFT_1799760 [Infundibulicybe gibba]